MQTEPVEIEAIEKAMLGDWSLANRLALAKVRRLGMMPHYPDGRGRRRARLVAGLYAGNSHQAPMVGFLWKSGVETVITDLECVVCN